MKAVRALRHYEEPQQPLPKHIRSLKVSWDDQGATEQAEQARENRKRKGPEPVKDRVIEKAPNIFGDLVGRPKAGDRFQRVVGKSSFGDAQLIGYKTPLPANFQDFARQTEFFIDVGPTGPSGMSDEEPKLSTPGFLSISEYSPNYRGVTPHIDVFYTIGTKLPGFEVDIFTLSEGRAGARRSIEREENEKKVRFTDLGLSAGVNKQLEQKRLSFYNLLHINMILSAQSSRSAKILVESLESKQHNATEMEKMWTSQIYDPSPGRRTIRRSIEFLGYLQQVDPCPAPGYVVAQWQSSGVFVNVPNIWADSESLRTGDYLFFELRQRFRNYEDVQRRLEKEAEKETEKETEKKRKKKGIDEFWSNMFDKYDPSELAGMSYYRIECVTNRSPKYVPVSHHHLVATPEVWIAGQLTSEYITSGNEKYSEIAQKMIVGPSRSDSATQTQLKALPKICFRKSQENEY
jgi:hypothetical protein